MAEYRAYVIGSDGHIVSATGLVCENDAAVIAQVRETLHEQTVEIWSGTRFIVRLDADR